MTDTRLNSPPMIPGNLVLGNLLQMKDEGVHFYPRVAKTYGDAVVGRVGWKRFHIFFHPDQLKEVLSDKEDIYVKGAQYNQLRHLLGTGLLTSQGDTWEKQRRLLNPLFGKNGLDILLVHINLAAEKFILTLKPEIELDWSRKMFDYTLEVAMTSFFGSNLKVEKLDDMAKDTHEC
ncbi:MAG: cytochrome P450, partial [Bdellovibrionales bacterium]|nr:cytochrome P450 [Bdellovibrionales bacterium]